MLKEKQKQKITHLAKIYQRLLAHTVHFTILKSLPGFNSGSFTENEFLALFEKVNHLASTQSCNLSRAVDCSSEWAPESLSHWSNTDLRAPLSEIWFGRTGVGPQCPHLPGFGGWGGWGCCSRDHALKAVNWGRAALFPGGELSPVSIILAVPFCPPASTPTPNTPIPITHLAWRAFGASLIVQLVKNPPAVWETWVQSLGWEDPLEKGKATHSSVLA